MIPEDLREELEKECRVEFIRASGPGGQHRNRRETGVRLTHLQTNTVVLATERRSQSQNLEEAYNRMYERLEEMAKEPEPRISTRTPKAEKRRRLEAKKHRSQIKSARRRPDEND